MLQALAQDFAAITGVRVTALHDARLAPPPAAPELSVVASPAQHNAAFHELAAAADWTVVIAPEIGGRLLERCRTVLAARGRLLGPSPEFVELTSDKHATARWLEGLGVPVPQGRAHGAGEPWPTDFDYPAVWKPRDGAGSQGIRLVSSGEQTAAGKKGSLPLPNPRSPLPAPGSPLTPGRLERFCPGLPVSIAFLAGPAGSWPLVPCQQRLSADGRFTYLGGQLPLEPALAARAVALGRRAMAALPPASGYVGLDLVLGDDPAGRDDVVIEVNPRLTTSYVGLRAAAEANLAEALLAAAAGMAPELRFAAREIRFDSQGAVAGAAATTG
jgi:predicted ATP-grasp superfamily ATP-dependent carboligase